MLQARTSEHLVQLLRAGQHGGIGSLRGPLSDAWRGSTLLCGDDFSGNTLGAAQAGQLRGCSFAPPPYRTGQELGSDPGSDDVNPRTLAERAAQIASLPAWLRCRRLGSGDLLRITKRTKQVFFLQPVPAPAVRVEVATDVPAGLGIGRESDSGFETAGMRVGENGDVLDESDSESVHGQVVAEGKGTDMGTGAASMGDGDHSSR